MKSIKKSSLIVIGCMVATLVMGGVTSASAQSRIAVLPFYSEEGYDAKDGGALTIHYRRMMGFISNQLSRRGLEVINPFAKDAKEREYNRVMERTREDSALAVMDVCKKYAVDAAYIVWLNVKKRNTEDGYCQASARVDGQGYDSAGRDLGLSLSKTFKVTKRDCDDAVAEVEKEVGDLVGRRLTAYTGPSHGGSVVSAGGEAGGPVEGGAIGRSIENNKTIINLRLDGATEYEMAEVFGKIVSTATGVFEAKRYASSIVPDNPQASYQTWRLKVEETDPFVLQANIMKMINDVLDNGGEVMIKGVPYRYSPSEVDLLKGIYPKNSTSMEIQFYVDRERARDREWEGRHDPYKAKKHKINTTYE